jgi:hypothetical protein
MSAGSGFGFLRLGVWQMGREDDGDSLHMDDLGIIVRVEKIESHIKTQIDPSLTRLEKDMADLRSDIRVLVTKFDNCANKNDIIAVMDKISEGNKNLNVALNTPSQDQATASFWMAALGSIAMVLATIAGIYGLFLHH